MMGRASPLLVISGSCSPVTAAQIEFARSNGFEEVILDVGKISKENSAEVCVTQNVIQLLEGKKDVIVHTGKKDGENFSSQLLGKALGNIAREAVTKAEIKRVVIAGGDTSSYAARAMCIDALEMIAPLIAGAPLCKAYSKDETINGIEVNVKGGQVGSENYFVIVKEGKL
jgi:uncharacterized protein YgbK (DUF1537 family)